MQLVGDRVWLVTAVAVKVPNQSLGSDGFRMSNKYMLEYPRGFLIEFLFLIGIITAGVVFALVEA